MLMILFPQAPLEINIKKDYNSYFIGFINDRNVAKMFSVLPKVMVYSTKF